MSEETDPLYIVSMFLSRFYHEEPDGVLAATQALRAMQGQSGYRWEVANAFDKVLNSSYPEGTLTEVVRKWANRRAKDDVQALEFLQEVFDDTALDAAIDPDLLTE